MKNIERRVKLLQDSKKKYNICVMCNWSGRKRGDKRWVGKRLENKWWKIKMH